MIAQLTGTVLSCDTTAVVIDVGGVGFYVTATHSVLSAARLGESITVYTAMIVREDSLRLYGFSSSAEREVFELSQHASGVGPKVALAIVNIFEPEAFRVAIQTGDVVALTKVPGVGKRGAEKIIVELKNKVASLGDGGVTPGVATGFGQAWRPQIVAGLTSLGWREQESERVCDDIADQITEGMSLGQMMKMALAQLGAKR